MPHRLAGTGAVVDDQPEVVGVSRDRKSTRLNSSQLGISYAVFCLKKKKLKTLFAPRATLRARALLVHPSPTSRLQERLRATAVVHGHVHNVLKAVEELLPVARNP